MISLTLLMMKLRMKLCVLIFIEGYIANATSNRLKCSEYVCLTIQVKILDKIDCLTNGYEYLFSSDRGRLQWLPEISRFSSP